MWICLIESFYIKLPTVFIYNPKDLSINQGCNKNYRFDKELHALVLNKNLKCYGSQINYVLHFRDQPQRDSPGGRDHPLFAKIKNEKLKKHTLIFT